MSLVCLPISAFADIPLKISFEPQLNYSPKTCHPFRSKYINVESPYYYFVLIMLKTSPVRVLFAITFIPTSS